MTIAGVIPVGNQSAGAAKVPGALGRDDFLNLLVTQLQYQDPLNPMDSTDFTAQLAQFSSLEQLTNMNDQLTALTDTQAALRNSQAVTYIGQTVLCDGNATQIVDGTPEPLHVELASAAAAVYVSIYDATGALRSTYNAEAMAAGRGSIDWPGTDMDHNLLPDGSYRFEIMAVDSAGNEVAAAPMSSGRVSGVAFEDGEAALMVNGQAIRLEDVLEIRQGAAPEAS